MLYKTTHKLVAIDPNLYLVKQPIMHTRNSNILQYQLFNTRTNYFNKTKVVSRNSLNPIWNDDITFQVNLLKCKNYLS
jgi:hypothetical protein